MILSRYWAAICRHMPDEMYLKWQFYHIYHRKLNLKQPQTYVEKLTYLKIHDKDSRLSNLVDKYSVREFVAKTIGTEYLIPLIGVYNSAEEIPWEQLPDSYVLKCTHDSGSAILRWPGHDVDQIQAVQSLTKHMQRNLFWYSREYPYRDIKPRIVCEAFIDDHGGPPSDYKIMCFDGVPHYVVLDMNRFSDHHRDIYNIQWIKQDITTDHEQGEGVAPRPATLGLMLKLATKLSQGFKHVRVDFYSVNGKVYFGEMTFFPWGGPIWFTPDKWNYILGDLIKLNG